MLPRTLTISLIALAAIGLGGCNSDSVTTLPDTSPPLAPQTLHGLASDAGRVVLKWVPNQEADLAGYNVYQLGPYHRVNESLVPGATFVAHPAPHSLLLFRVTAVDRSGNESAPSDIMGVTMSAHDGSEDPPNREGVPRP